MQQKLQRKIGTLNLSVIKEGLKLKSKITNVSAKKGDVSREERRLRESQHKFTRMNLQIDDFQEIVSHKTKGKEEKGQ